MFVHLKKRKAQSQPGFMYSFPEKHQTLNNQNSVESPFLKMLKVLREAQFSVSPSFALLRVLNSPSFANSRSFCSTPKPEADCFKVRVLPISHKPLFPGFKMPVFVKDSKLLASLSDAQKEQAPFAGAFLLKDEPNEDPNVVTGSESEKSIYDLKGRDLLNRLHDVGTLAQIITIEGEQVVLLGDRRIRITETVDEEPLTVKIDHLEDLPFSRDDEVLKTCAIDVLSAIRYVLKTTKIWREYVPTYTQLILDFDYKNIGLFAAAVSTADKLACQAVLDELDVTKRMQLALETLKKESEIIKKEMEEQSRFDFLPGLAEMQQMSQQPRMSQMSQPRMSHPRRR